MGSVYIIIILRNIFRMTRYTKYTQKAVNIKQAFGNLCVEKLLVWGLFDFGPLLSERLKGLWREKYSCTYMNAYVNLNLVYGRERQS